MAYPVTQNFHSSGKLYSAPPIVDLLGQSLTIRVVCRPWLPTLRGPHSQYPRLPLIEMWPAPASSMLVLVRKIQEGAARLQSGPDLSPAHTLRWTCEFPPSVRDNEHESSLSAPRLAP